MIARRDQDATGAAKYLPSRMTLTTLREAVQKCEGCSLYRNATQAVFGEGLRRAHLMIVGEQPGDQEDRQGKPFVGPSGRMLDKALAEVGIPRAEVFVTNAVKHFKFTQRGKRRMHAKPSAREIRACKPWLEAEINVVKPELLIAMGATAARSMFGSSFRVTQRRGELFEGDMTPCCMATVHPSSLLRMPDEESRKAAWKLFVRDMDVAAKRYREVVTPAPNAFERSTPP